MVRDFPRVRVDEVAPSSVEQSTLGDQTERIATLVGDGEACALFRLSPRVGAHRVAFERTRSESNSSPISGIAESGIGRADV